MVVGFTTTYAIRSYHHWCCEFDSRSRRGVKHYSYVIKFVSDFRQVGFFFRVLRFPPRYNWNSVESGVKHHQTNKQTNKLHLLQNIKKKWITQSKCYQIAWSQLKFKGFIPFLFQPHGGVMGRMILSSVVDRGCEPRWGQTKDYKIGVCCFSIKHTVLRKTSKEW